MLQREFNQFTKFISNIDPNHIETYKEEFFSRIGKISSLIEKQPDPDSAKDKFFKICKLIEESPLHQRTREKPLGYAGDFLLIDWIYTQKTKGTGIGRFYDEMFHRYEASVAVRNRKDFFIAKCREFAESYRNKVEVLDIGCGSCRDVIEAHPICDNGTRFYYHCVDHEEQAIDYAKNLLEGTDVDKRVHLDCCNAFHFRSEKQYDLIWSAGIFDYLENRSAIILLKRLWRNLKSDGQLVFGNFSPKNPTRTGMELIGKWYLIHRSAHELIMLCEKASIPYSSICVESEPMGVNFFCTMTK
ncbi:SAM-dependent methyltransferase [bacterium]